MIDTELFDLLGRHGLAPAPSQPVTLMRHKDGEFPLQKHIGSHALTLYQARQLIRHEPGGLIVGFYGQRPGFGLLLGVWRVKSVMLASDAKARGLMDGGFETDLESVQGYFHELEETDQLAHLTLKLEIKWGGGAISWRRILTRANTYPIALSSEPPVKFEGLNNASLIMAELRMALQDIHWQHALGSVGGIYLLTDECSKRHYVGSASGGNGVWQRWGDYARNGHGGNVKLVNLLNDHPGRENDFRFTLIEALPLGMSIPEVQRRESYWKTALGSRAIGLNGN